MRGEKIGNIYNQEIKIGKRGEMISLFIYLIEKSILIS